MSGIRPGARHFSPAAREAVCAGDPFNFLHKGEFRRRSDHRDLLAALLVAEGKAGEAEHLTAGGGFAARCLGYHPDNWQWHTAVRELCDLGQYADMGGCRTREALRAALLGAAARDYSLCAEAGAGISLAAWGGDDAAFSEDGC